MGSQTGISEKKFIRVVVYVGKTSDKEAIKEIAYINVENIVEALSGTVFQVDPPKNEKPMKATYLAIRRNNDPPHDTRTILEDIDEFFKRLDAGLSDDSKRIIF